MSLGTLLGLWTYDIIEFVYPEDGEGDVAMGLWIYVCMYTRVEIEYT